MEIAINDWIVIRSALNRIAGLKKDRADGMLWQKYFFLQSMSMTSLTHRKDRSML